MSMMPLLVDEKQLYIFQQNQTNQNEFARDTPWNLVIAVSEGWQDSLSLYLNTKKKKKKQQKKKIIFTDPWK